MSNSTQLTIRTLIHHYVSGTPQVANNYYGTIRDNQRYLYTAPDAFGFVGLAVTDLDTFGISDFRPIVRDGQSWRHIVTHHLDPFFNFTLNTEATADNALAVRLREAGCGEDCEFAAANTPESFIRLTLLGLEIQFPGGLGADLGDQDYRNLITARGQLFFHNRRRLNDIHYQATGRGLGWVVALSVAVMVPMLLLLVAASPLWDRLTSIPRQEVEDAALVIFGILILFGLPLLVFVCNDIRHELEKARGRFAHVTEAASAAIFRCAQRRQEGLSRTAEAIIAELSLAKGSDWGGRARRWAAESSRWTELLLWFQGRIAANHAFFLSSAMLNQMIEPTLRGKAQVEAATGSAGLLAAYVLATAAGGAAMVARWVLYGAGCWADAGWLGMACGLFAVGRWLVHRRVAYLEPETVYEVLQSQAFAGLKGPAEAQIPAKLARMMRQDRNRQLYDHQVHVGDEDQEEDDDDKAGR